MEDRDDAVDAREREAQSEQESSERDEALKDLEPTAEESDALKGGGRFRGP